MLRRFPSIHLLAPILITSALSFALGIDTARAEAADANQNASSDIADSGDVSDGISEACGSVSHEGCCAQNQIFFCENHEVKNIDCSNLQGIFTWCGWRATDGIYDCGTDGMSAPGNAPPFLCENQNCTEDCATRQCGPNGCGGSCGSCAPGEICRIDDGACLESQNCGDIGAAGCCDDDTLRFCGGSSAAPKLQEKDCAAMKLSCGWSEDGAWYDCGLNTREDPGGIFSRECPPLLPTCVPECSEKTCGDDGCFGSCGLCAADEVCGVDQRCEAMHAPDVTDAQPFRAPDDGSSTQPRAELPPAFNHGAGDPQTPPEKIVRSSCNATPTPGSPHAPILSLICLLFALAMRRAAHGD